MPPAALRDFTASTIVGVGAMPRAVTSQPDRERTEIIIFSIRSPNSLPSLPTTMRLLPEKRAKAEANLMMISGVRDSPNTPRIPEIEMMGLTEGFFASLRMTITPRRL